jgi:hypothetical protein
VSDPVSKSNTVRLYSYSSSQRDVSDVKPCLSGSVYRLGGRQRLGGNIDLMTYFSHLDLAVCVRTSINKNFSMFLLKEKFQEPPVEMGSFDIFDYVVNHHRRVNLYQSYYTPLVENQRRQNGSQQYTGPTNVRVSP